ncbi:uncharacterized protein H6S33_009005 [Morchella sextelata]|uniref:uncharacterized protein n=1 Tax=Morchella sextelata TaxID=1174677 RepID=UPI001D0505AB|nr:uncharacterized protein H6S33_009005 [Morchella sextelata]KAH0612625.1 hypothetical protein H6S33_009005 [Morchella sextelata]
MSILPETSRTPTQSAESNYKILCPTLWLEAELRRNSERSGVGGPNSRFTKSREDIFWEEFERRLAGANHTGRDFIDFKNLTADELRPLISECFRRSSSDFTRRFDDPRWNLGKSRSEIVEEILEQLLALREQEVAAESQSQSQSQLQLQFQNWLDEGEAAQEIQIEEEHMPYIDRGTTEATLLSDTRYRRA